MDRGLPNTYSQGTGLVWSRDIVLISVALEGAPLDMVDVYLFLHTLYSKSMNIFINNHNFKLYGSITYIPTHVHVYGQPLTPSW